MFQLSKPQVRDDMGEACVAAWGVNSDVQNIFTFTTMFLN
jgi:hypothetical protein